MVIRGQVVYSKCGHDKGNVYIVYSFDKEFVYLVDGNLRPVDKPKRKKFKHIQITNNIIYNIEDGQKDLGVRNAKIRNELKVYKLS